MNRFAKGMRRPQPQDAPVAVTIPQFMVVASNEADAFLQASLASAAAPAPAPTTGGLGMFKKNRRAPPVVRFAVEEISHPPSSSSPPPLAAPAPAPAPAPQPNSLTMEMEMPPPPPLLTSPAPIATPASSIPPKPVKRSKESAPRPDPDPMAETVVELLSDAVAAAEVVEPEEAVEPEAVAVAVAVVEVVEVQEIQKVQEVEPTSEPPSPPDDAPTPRVDPQPQAAPPSAAELASSDFNGHETDFESVIRSLKNKIQLGDFNQIQLGYCVLETHASLLLAENDLLDLYESIGDHLAFIEAN